VRVVSAEAMRGLGVRLAALLQAGDVVLLTGELGAGKTTLAQGIGAGLGVGGAVRSPTFVIARVHPGGRLPLVHVDAYRLGSAGELDDLDLDADLAASVTLVEWGEGLAERLAADRLQVRIERSVEPGDDVRDVRLVAYGDRWAGVPLPGVRLPSVPRAPPKDGGP